VNHFLRNSDGFSSDIKFVNWSPIPNSFFDECYGLLPLQLFDSQVINELLKPESLFSDLIVLRELEVVEIGDHATELCLI